MNKLQSSLKLQSVLNNLYAVLSRSNASAQVKRSIQLVSEVKKEIEKDISESKSGGIYG